MQAVLLCEDLTTSIKIWGVTSTRLHDGRRSYELHASEPVSVSTTIHFSSKGGCFGVEDRLLSNPGCHVVPSLKLSVWQDSVCLYQEGTKP